MIKSVVQPVIRDVGLFREIPWGSYWIAQNIFDFFWFERNDNITTIELVDRSGNGNNVTITGKDFATDYIPATSAAIFDCPDNATFIADDSDNLWINKNEENRGVDVSELIGYDFARTIICYDNASPHHIRAIGILKSTVTLTAAQINKLHTDFRLALFWSGVENVYGFIKANRGLVQNVWTAVSIAALDYSDTYETAVVADGGEIIKRKVVESEYQRLINTGDILSCWYSYHYQAGVKRAIRDFGGEIGEKDLVMKWYNLSPVVGRFGVDVTPLAANYEPEYTTNGIRFRLINFDGGTRCGLETGVSILVNNNNIVRIRSIVIPIGHGEKFVSKGYVSDAGEIYLQDALTTRKLGLGYRFLGTTSIISSTQNNVFADLTEATIVITVNYTTKAVTATKNGGSLTFSFGALTPIYPANNSGDCIGHGRPGGRNPFNGYVKQSEMFAL